MLVVMQAQATEEQVRAVCQKIEKLGYRAHSMPGAQRTAIGITGNTGEVEQGTLEEMPGVQEVIKVSKPYKLVSRDIKQENTVIRFPGTAATIGGPGLAIVAGPCASELWNVMSGALSISTSKRMLASRPVCADGVRTGSADLARMELKSERGLKPVRSTVMWPESVLLSLVPVRLSEALATVLKSSG